MGDIEQAEQLIKGYAAHLAEHPRGPRVEVSRYPPWHGADRSSIHLTVAFHDDGTKVEGIDHTALAVRVSQETGLALDPEYTGVFRSTRHGLVVYWWDWRQPAAEGLETV
jgi:hypothetical protein